MATNAEKIAALETALAVGEMEVRYDDFSVKYRSAAEIERAISYFKRKEIEAAGGKSGLQASYGMFDRGR